MTTTPFQPLPKPEPRADASCFEKGLEAKDGDYTPPVEFIDSHLRREARS